MQKILFVVLLTLGALSVRSQGNDISADRPGVATPPTIMQGRMLQLETGFAYEKITSPGTTVENTLFNTSLLRYGFSRFAELRLQTDYAQVKIDSLSTTGFNPLTLGTKVMVAEQRGIIPKTALLLNVTLPDVGLPPFRVSNPAPSMYLLMQNDIKHDLSICYNLGLEFDGSSPEPLTFAAFCLGLNFRRNISGFVESYNWFSPSAGPQNYLDFGWAYVLGNNLQLDLSGNMNLHDSKNYFMINFGFAWKMNLVRNRGYRDRIIE